MQFQGAKIVKDLWEKAKTKKVTIHLPRDFVCGDKFAENATASATDTQQGIPDGHMGLDIGPQSTAVFSEAIRRAKTIVWNGPAGVFEWDNFNKGTKGLLDAVVDATKNGATTIIG